MNAPILRLQNLKKSFAETEIIRGVELDIFQGERHAIIGPNGAGKSTLFHLISGNLKPTSGEIFLTPSGLKSWPHRRSIAAVWRVPFRLPISFRS